MIYNYVSPSFKFTFKIRVVLCLCPAHSIIYIFTNTMARWDPVGYICFPSASISGYEDGPEFIRCVDRLQPEIHEVWNLGEDGITPKVHPTECIAVGDFVGECFATNSFNPTWFRTPMFFRIILMEVSSSAVFLTS